MSTETTGARAALIRPIVAAASARGSPGKPVPKRASTITSACSTATGSTAAQPPPRGPPAPEGDGARARVGEPLQHLACGRRSGTLHQLADVVALLGRPHL